ncbi:family 43 glycosylhydrolase [Hymenobacter rigui]|nr:family 43 glycosylhydrolase [Hymenobacter rigui]
MHFLPFRRFAGAISFLGLSLMAACHQPAATTHLSGKAGADNPAAAAEAATAPAIGANPILPGDFPDPSVVQVGNTYWATATSSNWGPVFPLLRSSNLGRWELVGHVFPDKLPAWADYYFWAPEISQEGNKTYVYYTAHKRGGNLAVGVASADRPEGPYTDHGPLVGQPDGSIDGFPMRDEQGRLYLIWKEDGNSINQPTPIWAQPINETRTALVGEKRELFRNNSATWEGNLVEGVAMVRHDGYFYAFYAGAGCCGAGCTYATGVARAKSLLGPWEKYARNPVLTSNDAWKCPGHGTVVEYKGHSYLLHHAYAARGQQYVGRQGVLSEFTWTADGWPEFRGGSTPIAPAAAQAQSFTDEFSGQKLQPVWQWPVEQRPIATLRSGQLHLQARPDHAGAALGHSTTAPDYTATTTLLNPADLPAGCRAGLAAHGDPDNVLALVARGNKIALIQTQKGQTTTLAEAPLPAVKTVQLRVQTHQGNRFTFAWSPDSGTTWQPLPADGAAVDGSFLPPWDRGVRVGVLAHGPASATAVFERFTLTDAL